MKDSFDFYDATQLKSYNLEENARYQLIILDTLDVFTRKHSEHVANVTCRLCEHLHCSKSFTEYCTISAYLHDVGKQFIPPSILQKQSALTDEEYEIMKTHTTRGYKILMADLKLRPYAAGALFHHEALDGTGYPQGLTMQDIPYEGQIIRVADEYDAIVSRRQYKTHIGIVDTLKIMADECKPTDPTKTRVPIKDPTVGKMNPIIFRQLKKVVIEDTEYEIYSIMEYIKEVQNEIKRLKEVEKYEIKMNKANNENKRQYYIEGINMALHGQETIDNYKEILNSYYTSIKVKEEHMDKLRNEIKEIKRLKI